ncbi:MAG: MotA/TolQ/ExbB proton channel family protein [Bacteroidales bacterium]|nr:MotA/TolQ/ExbB proton channel family protein [Bacteroidales bacterium]
MKKLFMFLAVAGLMALTAQNASAQDQKTDENATEQVAEAPQAEEVTAPAEVDPFNVKSDKPLYQQIKTKFIEGGPAFMVWVVLCLILGLAIAIERLIYLSRATTNNKKLLEGIESALQEGGVEKAKELCRDTRGPVASIFYQGLLHYDEGLESVEKNITAYGGVQMGQLESGLSWIALFIALAPMLGFLGTVVGMVGAFDAIEAAGDISPTVVAGGIKVALITTIAGLIVAIILQIFYNIIVAKIDSLVNSMEDASINFVDILTKYNKK